MSGFRRSITDFSYSTNPKKQLLITLSQLRPKSREQDVCEENNTPQNDSIVKRMSRIINKQEDEKTMSNLLQFTKVEDKSEEARVKVRKRDRLKIESEFQLYQRSLHYSRQRNLKKAFDQQFKVKKEPQNIKQEMLTLAEIVAKKQSQNLIDSNWNARNNNIIMESLNNPQMRQKTLQKALLFEIYYDHRKSQIEEAMNKTSASGTFGRNIINNRRDGMAKLRSRQVKNRQSNEPVSPGMLLGPSQVPKIYKSINPRHLRIKTEGSYTQQQFRRARYVQTKTSLQYFQKAFNAVSDDNENKRKDNAELINMLVEINLQETLDGSENKLESRMFKRLYLHYSNHIDDDPSKLFTYVPLTSLEKLCNAFLPQIEPQVIQQMYKSMEPITIYKLHQVIHNLCKIIYKKANKQTVRDFIRERVQPRQKHFIDPFWFEMEMSKKDLKQLRNTNRKIDESIQRLYRMNLEGNQQSKSFLSVFQTLWDFNIFPNYMAKSKIKYYYEYSSLQSSGLSKEEFTELMIGVSLFMKKGQSMKASQKVKEVFEQFKYFEKT